MSKNGKIFSAAVVALLVIGAGAWFLMGSTSNGVAAESDSTVVAVVNGDEITRADVKAVASELPATAQVSVEQIYPMLLEQIINDRLLQARVDNSDITNDPEVEKRLAQVREQIVRSLYVERYIAENITDERVKEEYQKIKKENEDVKEVHARHILVETEDEAKALIQELEDGADFAALAKEHSTGPTGASGGDLGYFTKDAMVPEFSEAAFNTKKGTFSENPVKTQFGWHVIYVEDIRNRKVPEFAEMEQVIRDQLNKEVVNELVEDLREGAEIKKYDWEGKETAVN